MVFAVMSNTVSDPKLIICPSDSIRSAATNWDSEFITTFTPTPQVPNAANTNYVSYFVGGDALDTQPQALLTGDRNICSSLTPTVMFSKGGNILGVGNGTMTAVTYNNWSYTQGDLHLGEGNVGLADGSSQQETPATLVSAFKSARHSSSRTPDVISQRWFSVGNCSRFIAPPAAPPLGSLAPNTTRASRVWTTRRRTSGTAPW
jgi:hypothetical protein